MSFPLGGGAPPRPARHPGTTTWPRAGTSFVAGCRNSACGAVQPADPLDWPLPARTDGPDRRGSRVHTLWRISRRHISIAKNGQRSIASLDGEGRVRRSAGSSGTLGQWHPSSLCSPVALLGVPDEIAATMRSVSVGVGGSASGSLSGSVSMLPLDSRVIWPLRRALRRTRQWGRRHRLGPTLLA